MDHVQRVAIILNNLLSQHSPKPFDSTWIRKRAPACYSLIPKRIRSEVGGIDWDKITYSFELRFQPLWTPRQKKKSRPYSNTSEIDLILNKYRNKLYIFVAPAGAADLRIRDQIAIARVRLAQAGNLLTRDKVAELIRYSIDGWLDDSSPMTPQPENGSTIRSLPRV
jgi:hypothetical protein